MGTQKPKSPEFLGREVKRASDLWKETNSQALDRLARLRDNQAAWERYEQKRDELFKKLDGADTELENINQLYNLDAGIEDHKNRVKNAANIRKDIESVFKTVSDANLIVQVLLTEDMKAELNQQVDELKERGSVNDKIEDRLKDIDDFNGKIKIYIGVLVELEKWNLEGRKRMDELLAGPAPGSSAEDRVLMTMELGEDITKQLELHSGQETLWNDSVGPKKSGEVSDESKAIVGRMDTVKDALTALCTEDDHPWRGGQAVCCQREEMGGGGQGHQGVDHQDGGPRQDVGRPSSNCRQGHERHFRPFCQRHEAGRSGSPLEFPQGDVHPETENDGQYEPTYSSVIVRIHRNWPCRVKMSWIEGMNARKVLKEAITQM